MAKSLSDRIEQLEAGLHPVLADDVMAEAGRKVLLGQFIQMLKNEAGSRAGEEIEAVHDMRVAIRRTRSTLRLLSAYYKRGIVRRFSRELRQIAWALGEVRELDVLIENLRVYLKSLKRSQQTKLRSAIAELDAQRAEARAELNDLLDSRAYRRFIKAFSNFLTTPEAEVKHSDGAGIVPLQVRLVLPGLIYDRLAAVRAYNNALDEADATTLHALRIEFKRLRYTVSLFEEVLGPQINGFVKEVKALQDNLGNMNDVASARTRLQNLAEAHQPVLAGYLAHLDEQELALKGQFAELWTQFNTRRVQQMLSSAIPALN
jgi:CHAD domain-containing protein